MSDSLAIPSRFCGSQDSGTGSIRVLAGSPALQVPAPVSMARERAVAGRGRYYTDPLFPACFVCGTGRRPGGGLRIFPGTVAGRPLWAAPWTPDPSVVKDSGKVRPEVVWAALDCQPGGASRSRRPVPGDRMAGEV